MFDLPPPRHISNSTNHVDPARSVTGSVLLLNSDQSVHRSDRCMCQEQDIPKSAHAINSPSKPRPCGTPEPAVRAGRFRPKLGLSSRAASLRAK